jgi:hypothetical protein
LRTNLIVEIAAHAHKSFCALNIDCNRRSIFGAREELIVSKVLKVLNLVVVKKTKGVRKLLFFAWVAFTLTRAWEVSAVKHASM